MGSFSSEAWRATDQALDSGSCGSFRRAALPGAAREPPREVALSPRGASSRIAPTPAFTNGDVRGPCSGGRMRIETERLVLRLPQPRDAGAIVEYVSDPEVMRWIGGETGGRDVAVAAVERWLTCWDADGIGHFAVERKEDGRVLGRV